MRHFERIEDGHLLAPTGTQGDFFGSWSCGDVPATTMILQTTGGAADIYKACATATGAGGLNSSGFFDGGGSDTAGSSASGAGGASSSITNVGTIAVIVLSVILVLSIVGWVIWKCWKRQKDTEETVRRHA